MTVSLLTYPLRYNADANVFIVRVVGTSAPSRHCHDFEYAAALVGLKPKDYGLDDSELAQLNSNKEKSSDGDNNNTAQTTSTAAAKKSKPTPPQTIKRQNLFTTTGNPKPFICPVCARALSSKFYLSRHMISHSEDMEVSHVCDVCSTVFERQELLTEHLKTHEKAQKTRAGNGARKTSSDTDEKPFTCDICSREFNRNHTLQRHLNTFHSGKVSAIAKIVKKKTTGKGKGKGIRKIRERS
ncbi:unnamed protein product [Ambrosiozyma monospora]|uniref:Unnamed protein product n=1 Tax=Ambrosiozyma monospora TaxID=43982 RepID=A0ACB5TSC6_AMBMO|nr:unnamed protein product [Ambrosiozyma monospora]